jgi:hypothetical protein
VEYNWHKLPKRPKIRLSREERTNLISAHKIVETMKTTYKITIRNVPKIILTRYSIDSMTGVASIHHPERPAIVGVIDINPTVILRYLEMPPEATVKVAEDTMRVGATVNGSGVTEELLSQADLSYRLNIPFNAVTSLS